MTVVNIPGGNFSIARKMFESKIWIKSPLYLKLWIFLLGCANHTDREKNGIVYKRGELVTTYDKIIQGLTYYHNRKHIIPTLKHVRIILKWLQSERMIIVAPLQIERPTGADPTAHTRAYIGIKISILNYDTYQSDINYKGRHKDRPSVQLGHNNNNEEECINKYSLKILSYLNEKTGKRYRVTKYIMARLKDGATVEECQSVIDTKITDPYFLQNPKYLNPETLFRPGNFDKYKNEAIPLKTESQKTNLNSACSRCGAQVPPQDRTVTGCIFCENKEARA
jgi:uncharacterized phage protein (TIGR02220 family)